jgi:hypothetical protein
MHRRLCLKVPGSDLTVSSRHHHKSDLSFTPASLWDYAQGQTFLFRGGTENGMNDLTLVLGLTSAASPRTPARLPREAQGATGRFRTSECPRRWRQGRHAQAEPKPPVAGCPGRKYEASNRLAGQIH